MSTTPLVSILMPVYNGEKYVKQAIQSILDQTYKEFELIIINDGSSDRTPQILNEFATKDNRIKVIHNEQNLKICESLNKGMRLAQGTYIARMDSDDIVVPAKLEKQVRFLESNKDVDIVSSFLEYINEDGKNIGKRDFKLDIKRTIFYESPLCHACMMAKADRFKDLGGYQAEFVLAEDYDLWLRAYKKGFKMTILPEYLYKYRISSTGGKLARLKKQLYATLKVKENAIKNYHISFPFQARCRLLMEKVMYYVFPKSLIYFLFRVLKG